MNRARRLSIILCIIGLVLITYGLVIKLSSYKFSMTLNNENYKFFIGETLYYRENVTIKSDLNGYKLYVNKKKKGSNITLKDGEYHIVYKKFFKKLDFNLSINTKSSLYVVDLNNKEIHNYLSNTKPFKIMHDGDIKVDNSLYDDREIKDIGNYLIKSGEKEYNVNILEAF